MKTTHSLLILMAIMCLTFCKQPKSPEDSKTVVCDSTVHLIKLHMNTNEDKNSFEYANFGQKPSISNEEFTTKVKRGDIVIWQGVSEGNSADVVNIKLIKYEAHKENGKSTNFFGERSLVRFGDINEMVVGAIDKGTKGDTMIYSILINVQKKGEVSPDTLRIDPKMHM